MEDITEIAVLGMGNIGSEFVEILQHQLSEIEDITNQKIKISKILVTDLNKERNVQLKQDIIKDRIETKNYYKSLKLKLPKDGQNTTVHNKTVIS